MWAGFIVGTHAAAHLLRVSERRVRQLLADGRLTGRQTPDGWEVDRASVLDYRRQRGNRKGPASTRDLMLRLLEEVEGLRADVRTLLTREKL